MKLLRKLLVPATVVASLLVTTPAWASWNTMDGGNPFQVEQSCHDGIIIDWATDQKPTVQYEEGAFDPAFEAATEGFASTRIFTFPAGTDGEVTGTTIGGGTHDLPWNPSIIDGYTTNQVDGWGRNGWIHLFEGTQLWIYKAGFDYQPARRILGLSSSLGSGAGFPAVPQVVKDCYVNAPLSLVSRNAFGALNIAVDGTTHMSTAQLNPAKFLLRKAGAAPSSIGLLPTASARRDVNGDGIADLVLTYPAKKIGITITTPAVTVTGLTVSGGLLRGTLRLLPISG